MEYWDAYDKNMKKIDGVRLIRGLPLPDEMFHLVCNVIVQHVDGQYLLMQRDMHKTYPGIWEATAGGAALYGETPMDCIKRELREETGIQTDQIQELGHNVNESTKSITFDFYCEVDCPKDSIVLQRGETIDYQWVSEEEFLKMEKNYMFSQRMQEYIRNMDR